MTPAERVISICRERKIPVYKIERDLGYANAYFRGLREGKLPVERLYETAKYLGVSPEYLLTGKHPEQKSESGRGYYFSDETAAAAQEIFENKELRALFDAAKDCPPEVLKSAADLLSALKKTNPDG